MKKIFTVILLSVLMCTVGGVYATWSFAEEPANSESKTLNIILNEFNWAGSEILPEDDEIGENHIELIKKIVSHPEHGLNTSNSYLNKQIKDRKNNSYFSPSRDTLGSMAITQSEELDQIFGLSSANLNFLIYFKSDTEYHIFTTNVYLGERGEINILGYNSKPGNPTVPIGQNIYPIYKTTVLKIDGVWTPIETKEGYAKSDWYDESRRNENATQIPSFDPKTFVEGKL